MLHGNRLCFNSTKVQLEPLIENRSNRIYTSFNSTKVQLEPTPPTARLTAGGFNSTKVQLELKGRAFVGMRQYSFNSTKVQLERWLFFSA